MVECRNLRTLSTLTPRHYRRHKNTNQHGNQTSDRANSFYLIFIFVNSKPLLSVTNIRQENVLHREGKLHEGIHQLLSSSKG